MILVAALLAGLPAVGVAQSPQPETQQRPELFEALVHCRSITDDAARLQCFDTAAANLQAATERRDVVVVDRAQVRESRRRLFGLALPRLPIFGGGDDEDGRAGNRPRSKATSPAPIRAKSATGW